MSTQFVWNVTCILKGKENWSTWYNKVINAARFAGLWRYHLKPDANGNPPGPPGSQAAATSTTGSTTGTGGSTPATPGSQTRTPATAATAADIEKWENDDDRIRAAIIMVVDETLQPLIDEVKHPTAWDVMQVLKKNFDTKSDLEFVHLLMELNEIEMENGKAIDTINRLRPIKQHIDECYKNQCITWAFLIRSCIHLPRYNNLLTGLQSTGTLKQLDFEGLAERFIELDKTMDPKYVKHDPGAAFEVSDDDEVNYSKHQVSKPHSAGRGRGRGRSIGQRRPSNNQQNMSTRPRAPSSSSGRVD